MTSSLPQVSDSSCLAKLDFGREIMSVRAKEAGPSRSSPDDPHRSGDFEWIGFLFTSLISRICEASAAITNQGCLTLAEHTLDMSQA
jgi:hypothetical protein